MNRGLLGNQNRDARAARRFEAVCLAMKGKTLKEIAAKLHISTLRVQGIITQQAGADFYPQLVQERKKRMAKYRGFMHIDERGRREVRE